jgi:starvation-inducible DNA-binding protein
MKTLDLTKLDAAASKNVVDALQQLLSDYQVFYTNLRGFHWNVKGKDFFQLHAKFEEIYDETAEKVDEIAERILQLGEAPEHNFSEYLKTAKIKESAYVTSGDACLANILDTYAYLIDSERKVIELAKNANDEVTVSLLTDYLKGQEKSVWMLLAYASK